MPTAQGRPPFRSCVYDGDTTPHQRALIRQRHPNVLLTNPDMLHYALLAFHHKWEGFWKKLRYVIVDEMHTYRGIFGSHVAQIFRRLRRICRHYGSNPRFILLSATIGNPAELAASLTGVSPDEIATVNGESGAPGAKRHFVFLRPTEESVGHSAGTAARLIVQAAEAGLKTIAFTQSRKLTELVHMSVIEMDRGLRNKVSSYRAGFLPEERRVIEHKLADGTLSAVISTSALELGIDIGGLDLCILVGYPGTVMTTWQRGGRVGRSGRESAIVLIPDQDALDQYIVNHPARFLESSCEIAVIDPLNPEILNAHLPCAAAELPICSSEEDFSEDKVSKALEKLVSCGRLVQTLEGDQMAMRRGTTSPTPRHSLGRPFLYDHKDRKRQDLGPWEKRRRPSPQGMPSGGNLSAPGRDLPGRIPRSRKEGDTRNPGQLFPTLRARSARRKRRYSKDSPRSLRETSSYGWAGCG